MSEPTEPTAPAPSGTAIDYNAPVKVRSRHGVRILLPNALNGTLPLCDCHGGPDGAGAYWHPGQVIWMRYGEAHGEPNDLGVLCDGRAGPGGDVEAVPESAELYAVPKQK